MSSPALLQRAPSVDVPCSLFLGANTELAPADLPEGVSPDNQDCAFTPGNVFSRPGLHRIFPNSAPGGAMFTNGGETINYLKSYRLPSGNFINLYLNSSGHLFKEDVTNTPGTFTDLGPVSTLSSASYASSITANGKEYIVFHDGLIGTDVPRQYDGTNLDRISQDGPGANCSAADSGAAGSISAGVHKFVVIFLTRQGYLTKPSPIGTWTAAGSFKVTLSNIPIGPPNVIARVIGFTLAGGGNFFTILQNLTIPTAVSATVIPDNTTTTIDLDFNDNALQAAEAIDVEGNNLFGQEVVGGCSGIISYAGRLFLYGERNKLGNLLNMGFEGGTPVSPVGNQYPAGTIPLGWSQTNYGPATGLPVLVSTLAGVPADFGVGWQISGDGSPNPQGQLTQPAFQDFLGVPILQPLKKYIFRFWSTGGFQGASFVCTITSPTQGELARAAVSVNNSQIAGVGNGGYFQVNFNNAMPAVIPSDVVINIFALGLQNGAQILVDELQIIDAVQPFLNNLMRASYFENPEAFDGVTGLLGSLDDPSPVRALANIRNSLQVVSAERLHNTNDSQGAEPSSWTFTQVADKCGGVSARCLTQGEDFMMWYSATGLRIYEGGFPYKISQEVQSKFDAVTFSALKTVWIKNDANLKRVYLGVPVNSFTVPNQIFVMDYRESDTAFDISQHNPIHISFTGKMIASDLGRKWSFWNYPASSGEVLTRGDGSLQMCFGSGQLAQPNSSGFTSFANAYFLDSAKLTDDDYGLISPYYVTYFFVNHDMEMGLGVGSHRKECTYLAMYIKGVGLIQVTPLVCDLNNPWPTTPAYPLSQNQFNDLEYPMWVNGERIAFKIFPTPLQGTTDVQFNLQKLIVTLKKAPWSPVRGSL